MSDVVERDIMNALDVEEGTTPARKRNRLPLANTYAAKKTMTQGMMDVALITANANQMKFVLTTGSASVTYYLVLLMISISLALQVAVGVSLVFKGRCDLKGESKLVHANRINNYVVVGIFLITLINVFIAAFSEVTPANSKFTVRSQVS